MKSAPSRFLLFQSCLLFATCGFAEPRYSFDIMAQNGGSRSQAAFDRAHQTADASQAQYPSVYRSSHHMEEPVSALFNFSVLFPTELTGVSIGPSLGYGIGPEYEVMETGYSEHIHTHFWTLAVEADEAARPLKHVVLSVKGGIGYLHGRSELRIRSSPYGVATPSDFDSETGYSGFVFRLVPSVGLVLRRLELRLGYGVQFMPKVPANGPIGRLDVARGVGMLSVAW